MTDIIEISSLDLDDSFSIKNTKTSNFGGGIELLMNDKLKDGSRGGRSSR